MVLQDLQLVGRGAEADLYLGWFAGIRAVFKWRRPKAYRHPVLDSRIRAARTLREARIMVDARLAGVNAPAVLLVDPDEALLVIEYVEGRLLRDEIGVEPSEESMRKMRIFGRMVARLHAAGIVHGDLTTSNVIDAGPRLVLIDFGLAYKSERLEDRGVDVHVLLRALESTHPSLAGKLYLEFLEGYAEEAGSQEAGRVSDKVREIRMRGRYIEERRMRGG